MRKYPPLEVLCKVKVYKKGKDNYSTRKQTISKWSEAKYKVEKIERDMTLQKYYILEGLKKHFLRHELFLVNE